MSNMVVATNVMALNSHRNLKTVGSKQAQASARLSSGYRINSAADDAAGLAISEKMRAQIRGLDMASKNAQDGVSLIQTAEGGMQEIDNMLQRIRELVVQVSNDTNENNEEGTGDRQKIQDEIDQLVSEIDSMAERVEFNKKKVINGSYAEVSESLLNAQNELADAKLAAAAITPPAIATSALAQSIINLGASITARNTTNKSNIRANLTDAFASVGQIGSIKTAATKSISELKSIQVARSGRAATLLARWTAYSELDPARLSGAITQSMDDLNQSITDLQNSIGNLADCVGGRNTSINSADTSLVGRNASIRTLNKSMDVENKAIKDLEKKIREYGKIIDGTAVTTTDSSMLKVEALSIKVGALESLSAKNTSSLYLQVGSNAHQGISVNIGSAKTDMLGIGDGQGNSSINVVRETGADTTGYLDVLDVALSYVSTERSKLGATQNRLDYTQKSLDISSENLTAAESRVRDTDMAKEMMKLTQANVLQQAATSMLAQANQAPQSVLQLLG